MTDLAYNFIGWIQVHERILPHASEFTGETQLIPIPELEIHHRLDNDSHFQISIEKSLTSIGDTATVTITNQKILELLYTKQSELLKDWHNRDLEISIMLYYQYPHAHTQADTTNCIFTGDVVDIRVGESTTTVDQSLTIKSTMGYKASLRAEITEGGRAGKIYNDNEFPTYFDVVNDLFLFFQPYGYDFRTLDDPFDLLAKPIKKSFIARGKVVNTLNEIAKDLDMVWGFDSNPWTYSEVSNIGVYPNYPTDPSAIQNDKRCYWVDKRSVFDTTELHVISGTDKKAPAVHVPSTGRINSLRVSGDTGHVGLIGYTKSQFTFNTLFDPSYNVGMPVLADDVRAHLVEDHERSWGRINRLMINNNNVHCECSYLNDETGLAELDNDGKNTGALVI